MVQFALYARMIPKPEKRSTVESLLKSALQLAQQEEGTISWYAFEEDHGAFGIFDTFETEQARQAHLDGKIAKTLMARASELLAEPPVIHKIRVITAKMAGETEDDSTTEQADPDQSTRVQSTPRAEGI